MKKLGIHVGVAIAFFAFVGLSTTAQAQETACQGDVADPALRSGIEVTIDGGTVTCTFGNVAVLIPAPPANGEFFFATFVPDTAPDQVGTGSFVDGVGPAPNTSTIVNGNAAQLFGIVRLNQTDIDGAETAVVTHTLASGDEAVLTIQLNGNGGSSIDIVSASVNFAGGGDTEAPTAVIGDLAANGGTFTADITLSEDSVDLVAADLTLVNATAELAGAGSNFVVTLTPIADGTLSVTVPVGAFSDEAGNFNEVASNTSSAEFDNTAPTAAIGALAANGGTFTADITLSEDSADLVAADLTLVNTTAELAGAGSNFVVTLTPIADGLVSVTVPVGAFSDAAGNFNVVASNTSSAEFDGTAPTATIGALTDNGGTFTGDITLSEDSIDLVAADLTLVNATAELAGAGSNFVVTLTPIADGLVSVTVPVGAFSDAAGNFNEVASNTSSGEVDTTPPTATIGALAGGVGVFTADITLSEDSADLVAADLTLVNATAELAGAGANFVVTLTPIADGQVSVTVPAGAFSDAAGNFNDVASNTSSAEFDGTAPTATIGALADNGGTFTATITLSEDSVDLVAADLTLVNATAELAGAGSNFVVTLTPIADGLVSVTVPAGAFSDAAGNFNAVASDTSSFDVDTTPPTAAIGALTQNRGTFTADITLSEDSADLVAADLTLVNATAELAGAGSNFVVTLTPIGDGQVSVTVPAGAFSDAAGNFNDVASNTSSADFDGTAPTATIGALADNGGTFTASITLSEDSADLVAADLTLVNATAELAGAGSNFVVTLTPIGDGQVSVTVPAGAFSDAAGNFNVAASNTSSAAFDGTAPTVVLAANLAGVAAGDVVNVDVTFSEDVFGFEAADIIVANGAVENLSGGAAAFTATVRATGSGDLTVSVLAGAAADAAGNESLASNVLLLSDNTVQEKQETIAAFQTTRATQLIANQPEITGFLSGAVSATPNTALTQAPSVSLTQTSAKLALAGGLGDIFLSKNHQELSLAGGVNFPFWAQVSATWSDIGTTESRYLIGSVGGHAKLSPNLLLGATLQVDDAVQEDGNTRIEGQGWMVGPYFVAQWPGQPLFLDGRFLYGQASNELRQNGGGLDKFDSERLLAQAKISGVVTFDETRVIPSLRGSYYSDTQEAFIDNLGNAVGSQTAEAGQMEMGLGFETPAPFTIGSGTLLLNGEARGIAAFTNSPGAVADGTDDVRGRFDLGFSYLLDSGQLSLKTFYDGVGVQDFDSYGFNLTLRLKF